MNRVCWKAISHTLSLLLIGTAWVPPLSAQDRNRPAGSFSSSPGILGSLMRDSAVQSELALTEYQIAKLRKVGEGIDFFGKLGPIFQKVRTAETDAERAAARAEMTVAMDALESDIETQIQPILSEAQFQRALEIYRQRQGVRGLSRSSVIRDLELTKAQTDRIAAIGLEYEDAMNQSGGRSNEVDRRKIREDYETKTLGVLTDDQKAKWTAQLGKPFPKDSAPSPLLPPSPRTSSGLSSSRSGREAGVPSSSRPAGGAPSAAVETPRPTSYGMIDDDSITGRVNFVAVNEALATRGGKLPVSRDQLQLLTNLQSRISLDKRLTPLRRRLSEARTLGECAAIRAESCLLLEEWNAEIEQELQTILGAEAFAQLRPAILRRQGLWALTRPDVATELQLTPDQSHQLRTLLSDYRTAAAAAPADATPEERRRLALQFERKALDLLTPDQRSHPSIPLDRVGE